jgi:MFS superfamily sulfate permease-like transporter
MSKRNIIWLAVIVVVGVVGSIVFGIGWGLLAAAVVLVVSEVIERSVRRKRRAARGATDAPSVRDAVTTRRKRR